MDRKPGFRPTPRNPIPPWQSAQRLGARARGPTLEYLMGMDAGGTKTLCAVADATGRVVGAGLAGCGNFQVSGRRAASRELERSIGRALRDAGIRGEHVAVAFFGISGADRVQDFQTVREMLIPISPARNMFLENDTFIALRAGTSRGYGLGLISGTGTNAIGYNDKGQRLQVGGWGSPHLGDYGSAHDIAAEAFARAQRGKDGRGPPTILYERLVQALGVDDLVDISERDYFDTYAPLDIASFAPMVFDAACDGDAVALGILQKAGYEMSLAALAILRKLFPNEGDIPVVLGGSVFQKGRHNGMIRALEQGIRKEFPRVRFHVLAEEPVTGAILGAADHFFPGGIPEDFKENLARSMKKVTPRGR